MSILKVIAGVFACLFLVALWASCFGIGISVIVCVLKLCGLAFASTVSYWLPIQLMGTAVVSGFLGALCGAFASTPTRT